MDPRLVFALGGAFAAAAAFAGWRGARPPNPLKGPRLIPWRMLMVLTAAAAVIALGVGLRLLGVAPPGA